MKEAFVLLSGLMCALMVVAAYFQLSFGVKNLTENKIVAASVFFIFALLGSAITAVLTAAAKKVYLQDNLVFVGIAVACAICLTISVISAMRSVRTLSNQ